ncbi:hypothetical protein KIH39_25060 [Telmatocola sphagniphila]|uniref:Uncharacterized protein n=1 Tax=Telmatocola sphagniphila TaxID=1123043 RepID=A0A8E6B526_9BACT|nr:hypothetical protein [Telmatocola sphagniphila]QVL32067.1 hypothetical protein KIH39_25060 [Telmatocola sphagniphila]
MNSIFLEFNLPKAATWFYFSLLLAVAMFFNFRRPLSLRNWDVLGLFLIAPGFLILEEARHFQNEAAVSAAADVAAAANSITKTSNTLVESEATRALRLICTHKILYAYIWLVSASFLWFLRCLLDLGLVRRPYLPINLNNAGLTWLTAALFICITAAAIRRIPELPAESSKEPIALTRVTDSATSIFASQNADLNRVDTRYWVEVSASLFGHMVIVVILFLIGYIHFKESEAGLGAACLYLLNPSTAYTVQQVHHVWPAILLTGAVLVYSRPLVSGLLLGVAAGSAYFPLLLFPLWFGFYRGRGAGRFFSGFLFALVVSVAITALSLGWTGELSEHLRYALDLSDWQAWKRPKTESIWTGTHYAYRLPVFSAYFAFVIVTAFWPSPRHLGHVIAQSAAVVLGVQFWYADKGGIYVNWYLPLLLLMIFRPNLTKVRPPEIARENDWLLRQLTKIGRRLPKFRRFKLSRK